MVLSSILRTGLASLLIVFAVSVCMGEDMAPQPPSGTAAQPQPAETAPAAQTPANQNQTVEERAKAATGTPEELTPRDIIFGRLTLQPYVSYTTTWSDNVLRSKKFKDLSGNIVGQPRGDVLQEPAIGLSLDYKPGDIVH